MRLKLTIFLFAVLFLSCGCGLQKATEPNWQTYKFEEFRFSIDSPFPLTKDEKYSSDKALMLKTPALNGQFQVLVNFVKVGNENFTLKKIPGIRIKNLEDTKVFSAFEPQSRPTTVTGNPAILTEGTFKMFKLMSRRFKMLDVRNKKDWWGIFIQYEAENAESEKMGERVVQSFKITKLKEK